MPGSKQRQPQGERSSIAEQEAKVRKEQECCDTRSGFVAKEEADDRMMGNKQTDVRRIASADHRLTSSTQHVCPQTTHKGANADDKQMPARERKRTR